MLQILVGIISGFFSGLGMGGGTILIFLLTTFCAIEQHTAQATNLLFFIPTSIMAILVNIKNKKVDFKLASIVSIFGIIGAVIGAKISINTNVASLRVYFGIFLLIIALHEVYTLIKEYIKHKKANNTIIEN